MTRINPFVLTLLFIPWTSSPVHSQRILEVNGPGGSTLGPDVEARTARSVDQRVPPLEPPTSRSEWEEVLARAKALAPGDTAGKLRILITGLDTTQVLWRNLRRGEAPGGPGFRGHPYDLDGVRSPDQIVREGLGGTCGSYGKVLAQSLVDTGSDREDIFLVDTVGESERERATAARSPDEAPGSGHQFLLVRDRRVGWLLVDSSSRSFDFIPYVSPGELRRRMEDPGYAAAPSRILPAEPRDDGLPSFPNLLPRSVTGPDGELLQIGPPEEIFRDLVIFRVERSVDYPDHCYADRVREIIRVVPAPVATGAASGRTMRRC